MERDQLLPCTRITQCSHGGGSSIKAQAGETSCDFRIRLAPFRESSSPPPFDSFISPLVPLASVVVLAPLDARRVSSRRFLFASSNGLYPERVLPMAPSIQNLPNPQLNFRRIPLDIGRFCNHEARYDASYKGISRVCSAGFAFA